MWTTAQINQKNEIFKNLQVYVPWSKHSHETIVQHVLLIKIRDSVLVIYRDDSDQHISSLSWTGHLPPHRWNLKPSQLLSNL